MECFRQIFRCIKAPFTRNKGRVLEIGPPMNFRKEELPACFSDADTLTSQNSRGASEKDQTTTETVERQTSTKEKIQNHVRRMSIRLSNPVSESV